MKQILIGTSLLMTLLIVDTAQAQNRATDNRVGKMSKASFERANQEGATKVAAITPTDAPLSAADQDLMVQVAKGGMTQLESSRIAAQKASNPEVRTFAQGEVAEQTGLSDKLKAIAAAKGITLPSMPDADVQSQLTRLDGLSGAELDRQYVQQYGINGHELLDQVMSNVRSQAKDANLKAVESAAHPLVRTHLDVAREIQTKLGR